VAKLKKRVKIVDLKFKGYPHVLKSQQFDRQWVERILLPLSDKIEEFLKKKPKALNKLLRDRNLISIFAAESSRTRASHEIGFNLLGGRVAFSSPNANISGAMGKGESFEDTLRLFDHYHCDIIVARNDDPKQKSIAQIAPKMKTPVINAGDGAGKNKQHPTQALLDIYTIYRHMTPKGMGRGRGMGMGIENLKIAMIGDLKNGRTIRSLCYLLGKWRIKHIYFVSPKTLKIDKDIKSYLKQKKINFSEHGDIRKVAAKINVFYQTRTQTNLGSPKTNRNNNNEFTTINKEVLKLAPPYPHSIIMHPLPCLEEINRKEVDKDPRAVYINKTKNNPSQITCGLITRMALMLIILNPKKARRILNDL